MSLTKDIARIIFRRGSTTDISDEASDGGITKYEGEPRWNTTTKQLYIHDGTQNVRVPTCDSNGDLTLSEAGIEITGRDSQDSISSIGKYGGYFEQDVALGYATYAYANTNDGDGYYAVSTIYQANADTARDTLQLYQGGSGSHISSHDANEDLKLRANGTGEVIIEPKLIVKKDSATSVLRLERNQTAITTDDIVGRIEVETQDETDPGVCAKIEAISYGASGETGWRISCGTPAALQEHIRIDNNGNVGIGAGANSTIEPDALLHLEGVAGATQRYTRQDTTMTDDDIVGRLEFETQDSDSAGVAAVIQAEGEGSSGEVGLSFQTGTGGSATERMRIGNQGNIVLSGAFFPRQVDDNAMDATNGTEGEIVYNLDDNKFYGCTATGTPATWSAFN